MAKNKKGISTYIVIAFLSAVTLGGILTYFTLQFYQKVDVLVAARPVEPYTRVLVKEDFKIIEVAKRDKIYYDGFVSDANTLIGKMPISSIVADLPVKSTQVTDPNSASDASNVVIDKKDRGIYLTLTKENTLNGDIKVGSIIDFYLTTKSPKPQPNDPQYKETYVIPFQKSFKVTKCTVNEDNSMSIFFEFPMEESEKYLMIKQGIESKTISLISTLPNMIHDKYNNGTTLTFSEFQSALLSNSSYFVSVSDLSDSRKNASSTNVSVTNKSNTNATAPAKTTTKK